MFVEKTDGVRAGAEKTRWGLGGSGRKCEWRKRDEEGGRHCGRVGSLVAFRSYSCWKAEARGWFFLPPIHSEQSECVRPNSKPFCRANKTSLPPPTISLSNFKTGHLIPQNCLN